MTTANITKGDGKRKEIAPEGYYWVTNSVRSGDGKYLSDLNYDLFTLVGTAYDGDGELLSSDYVAVYKKITE